MQDQVLALVSKYMAGPFRPAGGHNILAKCPFHKGGNERRASFSINTENGLYHCFTGGCPAGSGTLKKLLSLLSVPESVIQSEMEKVKPYLALQQTTFKLEKQHTFLNKDPFKVTYPLTEAILGVYDFCPTLLVEQEFSQQVLREMGVGYDLGKNRITYPIRDMYGALAGFSGGMTPLTLDNLHQKYRVYQGRLKSPSGQLYPSDFGIWFDEWFSNEYPEAGGEYKCENHDYLWNFHTVWKRFRQNSANVPVVYVVEGFKACMWMVQAGFQNTVALMGSSISTRQSQMLFKLGAPVVLFLDNDKAGKHATKSVGDNIWKPLYGRVSVVQYPVEDRLIDTQPDSYETQSLINMVNGAKPFFDHLNQLQEH